MRRASSYLALDARAPLPQGAIFGYEAGAPGEVLQEASVSAGNDYADPAWVRTSADTSTPNVLTATAINSFIT